MKQFCSNKNDDYSWNLNFCEFIDFYAYALDIFQVHTADANHTGYKHVVQLTDDFKIVGINGSRILCGQVTWLDPQSIIKE